MIGKIYISIKDIAPLVGYEWHNGEYKINVEDTNKMYVESKEETETTSFYLNSNVISKVAPNTTDDYEYITISEPVLKVADKMYVISDGFTKAFNSPFYYDKEKNRIIIQTLPSLIEGYSANIEAYGYSKLSEDFKNQKALIYGMIVASKETTNKFGVVSTNGNEIISPRYNNIEFIESSGEFKITNSSNKVGIAYANGKTKITVSYDEIKLVDNSLGYYLVKSNNKYGIIDSDENFVVHIEYEQIGIDTSDFPADNISNQYILCGNIIPAKLNGKWQLLDIKGNRLTDDEYDTVGFINKEIKNKVINDALVIKETNTVIVSKDSRYGAIDVKGNALIPVNYDAIYSITSSGITTYYILFNEKEYNAVQLINRMKEILGYPPEQEEVVRPNTNTAENNSNSTNTEENSVNVVETENSSNTITNTVEN